MFRLSIRGLFWRAALLLWLIVAITSCGIVPTAPPPPLVITPDPLAASAADQVNPLRGLYRWSGQEVAPLSQPAFDSYRRYTWRELEPTRGQYDFSAIERELTDASQHGQRHAFRIRAMVNAKGMVVPDYLSELMPLGWWGDADNDGTNDTYIPDWNDAHFHERLSSLIDELGRRYNNDPRIAWVDVGFYGNWGEWHMWPFRQQYPQPAGAEQATDASKRKIVDFMAAAFPDTRLLMASENSVDLIYALRTYPQMGWRRDSLGDELFTEGAGFYKLRENPADWELFSNRWKTAPVITEFISPNAQKDPAVYQLAIKQAAEYHVSLVSNGNTLSWDRLSPIGREAFLNLGRLVGYRYKLNQLSLPSALRPNQPFTIQSLWSNNGNAPTYEPWDVRFQLRNIESGQIAWDGQSTLDLRTILPYEPTAIPQSVATPEANTVPEPSKTTWADSFTLPGNVVPGRYSLILQVVDPASYRAAMELSIIGGQTDRSYTLGTITVSQP